MSQIIGKISLNISLVLYLINYAPQIFHNQMRPYLSGMSFYFHYLLLISWIADLIYGIGMHMPWQYRLVSVLGLLYLLIQHVQIRKIIVEHRSFQYGSYFLFCATVTGFLCLYFYKNNKLLFISLGYLSEIAGWISCFPQIIKNLTLTSSALSLSMIYLLLDLFSAFCDNVSAWVLVWPTPSKLGAIFSVIICLILITQRIRVQKEYTNECCFSIRLSE